MLIEGTRDWALPGAPAIHPSEPIVHYEQTWFGLLNDDKGKERLRGVMASRWTGFAGEAREEVSEFKPDCHVLGVTLRPMDVTAFAAKKLIHDGRAQQGMMRVNEPGLPLRAIFRGAYDTLHLHIKNTLIEECIEAGGRQSGSNVRPLGEAQPSMDPVIERLATALIRADDFGGTFGQCYADGVGMAIVARLLARSAGAPVSASGSRVSKLSKWRLKRATDYVEAHLSEPIGLADIAAATGLTRMHFAAQFRASIGLRPHEYLVRRRIERAQELLAASNLPLVEVALEVGFKAQAHFTTVFSRVVGETPNVWRRQNCMSGARGRMAGHR